jgi:hypothetical protein
MPRLACTQHKSRVLVLETKTVHRSSGETCTSPLHIGEKELTSDVVRRWSHLSTNQNSINTISEEEK